jgi:hypothetical protein
MRQLRPPASSIGGGSKKLHAKAAAEKQQSITLVNQSFDERKIVVLRSDASDKTAKQSEAGYPRVDTIFVNTSAFFVPYLSCFLDWGRECARGPFTSPLTPPRGAQE